MGKENTLLKKIRLWTLFYILALLFWGITAFPIESEMMIVCQILGISPDVSPEAYTGLTGWIATVFRGVKQINAQYPFLAYGTDWLAFSHIVIAVAFIGVYQKPVRNKWVVYWAMIACIGVIPLALICGPIREIPFFWRLIDSSFCVFGLIPLWLLHTYIKQLEGITGSIYSKY